MSDQSWMDKGACLGLEPDDWFPERDSNAGRTHDAIRVCRTLCTVRDQCLEYALTEGLQFGIFGGMRPEQRQAISNQGKKQRRKYSMTSRLRTA